MVDTVDTLQNNFCRCCHTGDPEGTFINLGEPQIYLEEVVIYSDLIKECLGIEIKPMLGNICELSFTICPSCIQRLRDVKSFKTQVINCEKKLWRLCTMNKAVKPETEVKNEKPDGQARIKIEATKDNTTKDDGITRDDNANDDVDDEDSSDSDNSTTDSQLPSVNTECESIRKKQNKTILDLELNNKKEIKREKKANDKTDAGTKRKGIKKDDTSDDDNTKGDTVRMSIEAEDSSSSDDTSNSYCNSKLVYNNIQVFKGSKNRNTATNTQMRDIMANDIKDKMERGKSKKKMGSRAQIGNKYHANKSTLERCRILVLSEQGNNISQIARALNITRGTVRRWITRHQAEGHVTDRPRPRPPPIFTPERITEMLNILKVNPYTPTSYFAEKYNCHARTVRMALHKHGFTRYVVEKTEEEKIAERKRKRAMYAAKKRQS